MSAKQTRESVLSRIIALPNTECTRWDGVHNTFGRPRVRWHGAKKLVAVLICEWTHGVPTAPANRALHSCHNEWCVTGTHLRWGTQSENVLEMWESGNRQATPCPHRQRKSACTMCRAEYMRAWQEKKKKGTTS